MTLTPFIPDTLRSPDLRVAPADGAWTLRWTGAADFGVDAACVGCRLADGSPPPAPPIDVAHLQQVHSATVTRVAGPGLFPACDAAVTAASELTLVVRVADCVPVFLAGPRGIGVAHAGWRGTVEGITRRSVAELVALTGDDAAQLRAFIGPSIGPCCFEVGPEVAAAFAAEHVLRPPLGRTPHPAAGREHVDLWAANRAQLIEAGLPPESVRSAGICTRCHQHLFHSYRGSGGQPGRIECRLRRRGTAG